MSAKRADEAGEWRDDTADIGNEGLDVPAAVVVIVFVCSRAVVKVADEDVPFGEKVV